MDSNRITIERITDYAIAIGILKNDVIASEIYEDSATLDAPDLLHEYWIAAHVGNRLAGCYRIHAMGAVLWQIHCRILPQFRQRHAEKISVAALCWSADNIPGLKSIMCFVPECHANVAMHCKRVGFRQGGTIEKSYLKNGQAIDQAVFVISIDKINSYMEQKKCQQQRLQ